MLCFLSFLFMLSSVNLPFSSYFYFPHFKSDGSLTTARLDHFPPIKRHFVVFSYHTPVPSGVCRPPLRDFGVGMLGMPLVHVMKQHTHAHTHARLPGSLCGSHDNNNGHTGQQCFFTVPPSPFQHTWLSRKVKLDMDQHKIFLEVMC